MVRITPRTLSFAVLIGLVLFSFALDAVSAQEKVVRIAHLKQGGFGLLKERGNLEERLRPLGYTVTWTESPAGPPLFEGIKAGTIDFTHSGEAPPIFAQAAGASLLYIGHEHPEPKVEAILVPKDSPIKTIADLKGKKIALNRGSNVHYLLVRALEKAGLNYTDVEPIFLPPVAGRAAFEKGTVDAWVIWEPNRTDAEMSLDARTLADGTGLVSNHDFYFTSKTFAEAHPQIIKVVLSAMSDVSAAAAKDIPGTIKTLSAATGFPERVIEVALSRRSYGAVRPMDDHVIAEQQKIADTFKNLGLIPMAINVSDAVWR
jgi:sulfonate transport system substrate-binding protein